MWLVTENTPGYLPEAEPMEFEDYEDAYQAMVDAVAELSDEGYEVDHAVHERGRFHRVFMARPEGSMVAPDLGRVLHVEEVEGSE